MQMTKAQAVAELERIQKLLPLIAEVVKEERKPVNRYAKTSYFKEAYGQSMGTVKNRKYGIMNQIKLGRYPKDAIIDRYIDKAVYADYKYVLLILVRKEYVHEGKLCCYCFLHGREYLSSIERCSGR